MIPVRVQPGTTVHRVGNPMTLDPGHPLFTEFCPVCDNPFHDSPLVLVYVGAEPGRHTSWRACAVAVHEVCAGPHGESAATVQANAAAALAAASAAADLLAAAGVPDSVIAVVRDIIDAFREVTTPTPEQTTTDGAGSGGP